MTDKELGERIKELRGVHGWSQRKLEYHAGLSTGYVSALEKGEQHPKRETLEQIARAFRMSVAELTGEKEAEVGTVSREQAITYLQELMPDFTRELVARFVDNLEVMGPDLLRLWERIAETGLQGRSGRASRSAGESGLRAGKSRKAADTDAGDGGSGEIAGPAKEVRHSSQAPPRRQ